MADGATMATGRAGLRDRRCSAIDNATNPVGAGNSPPLASKSDEMPALPKPTEMPDLPSQMSALGLSDGARRLVLPASYSKRKTASGFGASQVRPNLPSP